MSNALADTTKGSAFNVENLDEVAAQIDERMREDAPADTTGQSDQPAEPPVSAAPDPAPTPEAPKTGAWRDMVLDDVDHGVLKGQTGADLWKSYENSVRAMQTAQTERNSAARRVQELESELVQSRQPKPQAAPPSETQERSVVPNPDNDPVIAKINEVWYDDPALAARMLLEHTSQSARTIATDVYNQNRQAERTADGWNQLKSESAQASSSAMQQAIKDYGWSEEQAATAIRATFALIAPYEETLGITVWANPANYLWALEQLPFVRASAATSSDPAPVPQPEPAAQAPDIPNPPGSRKPVPAAPRTPQPSALTREEEQARRQLAKATGLDPDLVLNTARKRAERGGHRAE